MEFPWNSIATRTKLVNAELAIETKTMQILDFDQPFSIDKLVEIFLILTQLKQNEPAAGVSWSSISLWTSGLANST